MKNERQNGPKSVEIHFGMIFENEYKGTVTRHVVIELGEKNYFFTCQIVDAEDGKRLSFAGTSGLKYITRVTGETWTKDQILEAYGGRNFIGHGGTPESSIETINLESQKPPRIIS